MLDGCSLVLEHGHAQPLQTKWAVWWRWFVWLVIIIGALSVLVAEILTFLVNIMGKYSAYQSGFVEIMWVCFKPLLHLGYLYLIFWLLIFKEPIEKLHFQKIILPALLCGAYLCYAFKAYFLYLYSFVVSDYINSGQLFYISKFFDFLSLLLFLGLYIVWLKRDICELKENTNPRRTHEIIFWLFVEVFLCIAIFGAIAKLFGFDFAVLSLKKIEWFFDKDAAIIIALILWGIIELVRISIEKGAYRDVYEGYLHYNTIDNIESKSTKQIQKISLPEDAKLLDVGCGNGQRLNEIIDWLELKELALSGRLDITGSDKDETWGTIYQSTVKAKKVSFLASLESFSYEKVKLVVLSHVLYEPKTVEEISTMLQQCDDKTIVVIRGASPVSFFSMVSVAFSLRPLTPTVSHNWYTCQLDSLIEKINLVRINQSLERHEPDIIVKQQYELNPDSIQRASALLGFLYQKIAGEMAGRFFKELSNPGGLKKLPNEDFIYLFEINKPDRERGE